MNLSTRQSGSPWEVETWQHGTFSTWQHGRLGYSDTVLFEFFGALFVLSPNKAFFIITNQDGHICCTIFGCCNQQISG